MKVRLHPFQGARVLASLPPPTKRRLKDALRLLAKDPTGRTENLDVRRLDVNPGPAVYRLRIGEWRIAFTVDDDIFVTKIFHRDEGYGWLADLE